MASSTRPSSGGTTILSSPVPLDDDRRRQEEEAGTELRRGPWTVEEDLTLVNYIADHGEGRWNSLARGAGSYAHRCFHPRAPAMHARSSIDLPFLQN